MPDWSSVRPTPCSLSPHLPGTPEATMQSSLSARLRGFCSPSKVLKLTNPKRRKDGRREGQPFSTSHFPLTSAPLLKFYVRKTSGRPFASPGVHFYHLASCSLWNPLHSTCSPQGHLHTVQAPPSSYLPPAAWGMADAASRGHFLF